MSTACPFTLCNSVLTMIAELKEPGSNEALRRVPQHRLGGHEDIGLCPASLMLLPLSEYDSRQLVEMAMTLGRMISERRPAVVEQDEGKRSLKPDWADRVRPVEPYRMGRRARPAERPQWFRDSKPGQTLGQQGYDKMPQVLTPRPAPGWVGPTGSSGDGSNTQGSDAVTSVEDVKRMIARADEISIQAADALFVIEGEVSDAAQLLNTVRETSSSDMGAPDIIRAIEHIGEAAAALRLAVDKGREWRATH